MHFSSSCSIEMVAVIQNLSCMVNIKLFLNALSGRVDLGACVCFMCLLLVELQYWLSKKPWETELNILFSESAPCEGRDPFHLKVSETFFHQRYLRFPPLSLLLAPLNIKYIWFQ